MKMDLLTSLYVFLLAAFIGFEVIRRITRLLHRPPTSPINALDAIAAGGTPVNLASSAPYHASQLYARHWQLSI